MADSKVSEMTAATAAAAADKMYLVQGSNSKSVTNAVLFGNIACLLYTSDAADE